MRIFAHPPTIEPLEARIAPAAVLTATLYTDKALNPKTGQIALQFIKSSAATAGSPDAAIAGVVEQATIFTSSASVPVKTCAFRPPWATPTW